MPIHEEARAFLFLFLFWACMLSKSAVCSSASRWPPNTRASTSTDDDDDVRATSPVNAAEGGAGNCLSWRMAVEADNVRAWRTVPTQCLRHVENYMTGPQRQYDRDLSFIVDNTIATYIDEIVYPYLSFDGFDAWILDVDETCLSNLFYYRSKRFGCDPYDPEGFKSWALRAGCPAIPAVLRLFNKLLGTGLKVFLITGRDELTLGQATLENLHAQGYIGYERLILRTAAYKGQSAVVYKSEIRKELEVEGYRIWGNVGDQWSDVHGDCPGNRTFKLPNPMYFVP